MEFIFILVKPEDAKNIGSAARALKTMGHSKLYLVNPCPYLTPEGYALAHGSADILGSAKVFSTLSEAAQSVDFLVGTTARHRRLKHRYHSCRDLPQIIKSKGSSIRSVGLVFGGETSGLSNEDLQHCDLLSTIPLSDPYPSVNLAQSVMIYSFLFSQIDQPGNRDWRIDGRSPTDSEYQSLKSGVMGLVDSLDIPDPGPLKRYLQEAISRLGYDDLYLVNELKKRIVAKLSSARGDQTGQNARTN